VLGCEGHVKGVKVINQCRDYILKEYCENSHLVNTPFAVLTVKNVCNPNPVTCATCNMVDGLTVTENHGW